MSAKLHYHAESQCHVCRRPVFAGFVHRECQEATYLDGVWVGCAYEELAHKIVHELKYKFNSSMAKVMARIMYRTALPWGILDDAIITFVPISSFRKRWRGFNQAELLASEIAKLQGVPNQVLLTRKGRRHTQVGMNRDERQQNLHGSIGAANNVPGTPPHKVVIVDDVMTTGSTLEVCAKVLKQSGISEVYGLVFARG